MANVGKITCKKPSDVTLEIMIRKRQLICVLLLGCFAGAMAQSGTNSPYSQYGLGVQASQAGGVGRGMNGVGTAYREHNQVNVLNPASYAVLDSLTFIFDVGLSAEQTNYKEGGKSLNARNANFEYAVAALRLSRHLGFSFGVLPYTNVGYSYSVSERVGDAGSDYYTSSYSGSGGLREVYVGTGWEPLKGFAIGVNAGYLWGGYDRSVRNTYSDSYVNTLSKLYSADVRNYKLDFGVQFTARVSKKDRLTIGATYGLGHKIGGDPTCKVVSTNSQTGVADTLSYPLLGSLHLEIPTTFSAGLMWYHNNKVKVGADYTLQKWVDVSHPEFVTTGETVNYALSSNYYTNRHQFAFGVEICPGEASRRSLNRIRYRAGVSYATPYLKINGNDGPKEMSASIGFGIPIVNGWNNRSMLNISAQWVRQDSKMFITENQFRINVGMTFNERWFDKWKVE